MKVDTTNAIGSHGSRSMVIGGRTFTWGVRTYVMGVLNVTPDSFSGDGLAGDVGRALDRALEFEADGADIIDIGGESSRPKAVYRDARPVSEAREIERVMPVIEALAGRLHIPISIDTRKSSVARLAVGAGAGAINDVSMLRADPAMAATMGELGVPVVLNHNRERAVYPGGVVAGVVADLSGAAATVEAAGLLREQVILDPGIGFGKTPAQSLEMQARLRELVALGYPVLVGTSRKSSIGAVLGLPADDRLEGTAATVALAIDRGADIVRVHDVKEMARVSKMADAIVRGWTPGAA